MYTIKQLLQVNGNDILSIAPDRSVYDALQIMAEKDIGALLVIDKDKLVGIFSERDYARKVILKGKASKETTVGELMTKELFCVFSNCTIQESMELMTTRHIRHLPIMENDLVVGFVTIGDVVKQVISDQELAIHELEKHTA